MGLTDGDVKKLETYPCLEITQTSREGVDGTRLGSIAFVDGDLHREY